MIEREDRVALVTGAGDGIGRALSIALADSHVVLAVDIRRQAARDVAEEIRS